MDRKNQFGQCPNFEILLFDPGAKRGKRSRCLLIISTRKMFEKYRAVAELGDVLCISNFWRPVGGTDS